MPAVRYFAQVGSERIEFGQDETKKEDPFKPLQTGRDIDHWEAEITIDGVRYLAVSNDSLKDAARRLERKLPEDVALPDRTVKASAADSVSTSDSAGGKS